MFLKIIGAKINISVKKIWGLGVLKTRGLLNLAKLF